MTENLTECNETTQNNFADVLDNINEVQVKETETSDDIKELFCAFENGTASTNEKIDSSVKVSS